MTAQIVCWNCLYGFKPRKEKRKVCPECGSPYWKAPSIWARLTKAFQAFRIDPRWKTEEEKHYLSIAKDNNMADSIGGYK